MTYREGYQDGYQQARKDLALKESDIELIRDIMRDPETNFVLFRDGEKAFNKLIAQRFNKERKDG